LEAVVACAHLCTPGAVTIATQVLEHPRDKFIDYSLRQAVRALEPQWKPVLAKLDFGGKQDEAAFVKAIATAAPVAEHPVKAIYDGLCLNCHQPEGKGLPGVYPPLAESDWVRGAPDRLIKIVLHGLNGPIHVKGEEFKQLAPVPMPPMGLNDQQAADVLSYVRSNFGNNAAPVAPAEVQKVRADTEGRAVFWTAGELGGKQAAIP
jgi:mono/diheme cytochrome c family protein